LNSVKFGKSNIRYRIQKSSRRKTTEILVGRTGVQILTSKKKSQHQINNLVQKHARWIFKKRLLAKEEKRVKITFENGSRLPFLGKNYLLDVKQTKKTESFRFRNGKFFVRINKTSKPKIRKLYQEWSKEKIIPVLDKSIKKYSKKIGVETGKIIIKNQKNRWGSVSKKGTINFNQNLIRAPSKIIDYVAAHEVCHLKIPNHTTRFWNLLHSIFPNYLESKEWLRINREFIID